MTDKEVEEMFYVEGENFLEELKNGKYVQLNEEGIDKVVKIIAEKDNVIDGLEKWLDLAIEVFNNVDIKTLELVKRKLQELKGDK